MKRVPSALAAAAIALTAPAAAHAQAPPDAAIQWNRTLLALQATPGVQPATVQPTYELALMHAAIADAVVAIDHSAEPYLVHAGAPRFASPVAAADAAAHATLVSLYPAQTAALDQDYAAALADVPDGLRRAAGVRVGEDVARRLLARRADDGSTAAPLPFTPGTQPGDYQPTPPAFAAPVFTHWAAVTPFTLARADQFRPGPPPVVGSREYDAALAEVQALGAAQSTQRTPEQTQIATLWNPGIWITWNQIAQTASLARHASLSEDARTFARLNLAFADTAIAFYDAKYFYHRWRPITAIRASLDPAWTPLNNTPPDPSYPGAHSAISAAAATILAATYGDRFHFDVTTSALPGVTRAFDRFSDAAEEAGVSRIYAGVHTRSDHVAGAELGFRVGLWTLTHALRR